LKSNNDKNKSIWENVYLVIRGYKTISRFAKGFVSHTVFCALLRGIYPLVNVYLTARLLDNLSRFSETGNIVYADVIFYISAIVIFTLITQLTIAFVNKRVRLFMEGSLNFSSRFLRAHKFASIPYEVANDIRTYAKIAELDAQEASASRGLLDLCYRLGEAITSVCSILIGFVLFFMCVNFQTMEPIYVCILFIATIIPTLISVPILKNQRAKMTKLFAGMVKANALASYYMGYILPEKAASDIRIFAQTKVVDEAIRSRGIDWIKKYAHFSGAANAIPALLGAIVQTAVYILVGISVLIKGYGIGEITQSIGATVAIMGGLKTFSAVVNRFKMDLDTLESLFELLDQEDELNTKDGIVDAKLDQNSELSRDCEFEFHNVSFKYHDSDDFALENVNLKFRFGKRYAIVGENGSGKTTLIKLLSRLYQPTEGYITLNGRNINELSLNEYRNILSVVLQDFELAPYSIAGNVSSGVGNPSADRLVKECLEQVDFTDKYDINTCVTKSYDNNGISLSGGEAQKVAIARAIFRDSPIIVLDEPTASLDPIAEAEIYEKFNSIGNAKEKINKLLIYVSHRLSSCRFCDYIVVFDGGRIVENGKHEELLPLNGKYTKLWKSQAEFYR
jgi:ATP-binding cassette subfamily B protein